MKVNGKWIRSLFDSKGNLELTFKINNYQHVRLLQDLTEDTDYGIVIKKIKSKRSINQNSYLWAIIHEIELVSDNSAWEWYIAMLEESGSKYEYVLTVPEAEENLKQAFRAVKLEGVRTVNDKKLNMYKCFYGSSKFNVEEMNRLIEVALKWANEFNLKIDQYEVEYET